MGAARSPDIFVSGLDHIEMVGGGCARFVLYVNKVGKSGKARREPVNIVMPLAEVPDAVRKTEQIAPKREANDNYFLPAIFH